ncbi:MAG: LysR substrate-binding domain-containing protein [Bacteroidia bacterium]|jgi:LysR family hydrogen peroxide-inducible transcriptional activator|nr:LysR substrate-binding domain-containing protein [Bacteroidia bacterium]
MTITQLEYIIAVDTHGNFLTAAEKCSVSQPALSMQIQKLEKELGIRIFDRSRQPVVATEVGIRVIQQAREILKQCSRLSEMVNEQRKGELNGVLRVGIIPTIAPYILPLFLVDFMKKHPKVNLEITEITTAQILQQLKNDQLDCGILATPIEAGYLQYTPLFYEPLVAYVSDDNKLFNKKTLSHDDIDAAETWILNEGHCLRNQVLNLCQGGKGVSKNKQFQYQTGSLETLKRMVEMNNGVTILPELSIFDFNDEQMERVRYFKRPEPVREISVVTHRVDLKRQLIESFTTSLLNAVPDKMKKDRERVVVELN